MRCVATMMTMVPFEVLSFVHVNTRGAGHSGMLFFATWILPPLSGVHTHVTTTPWVLTTVVIS